MSWTVWDHGRAADVLGGGAFCVVGSAERLRLRVCGHSWLAVALVNARPDTDGAVVRLPPICRLRDLAGLYEALLIHLEAPEPVSVDAGEVESVDTGTLQLLYAFERDRTLSGRETRYAGASPEFRAALASLGLSLASLSAPTLER